MKDQILKMAGVKSEKEFYNKFPTEESFKAKYGKQLKKAEMGSKMVNTQLHQLTDFGNPPKAQVGWLGGGATSDPSTGMINSASGTVSKTQTDALGFADKAPGAGGFDYAGAAMAGVGALPGIIAGAQKIGQQNDDIKKANQAAQVSQVVASAAESRPEQMKRKYVEAPIINSGGTGVGTNFLSAANGTMIGGNPTQIQNTYAPTGDLYGDLGYEPLNDSNTKKYKKGGYIPTAEFGDYFQDSGQAEIGGAAGQAIGTALFGPLGGMAGKLLGNVAGNLLGGADDMNKLHRYQDATQQNTQRAAFASGANALHSANSANMEDGGYIDSEHKWMSHDWQPQVITHFGDMNVSQVHNFAHQGMDSLRAGGHLKEYTPPSAEAMFTGRPNMALGGELQSHWGGGLETISHNPYDASEIVMPKGNSHEESDGKGRTGIGITYGNNPVEVERNEPIVKMDNGGNQQDAVVFGNMIEDESGKKYKVLAKDIAENNNKQTKLKDKAIAKAAEYQGHTPYDQFKMNSSIATSIGTDMKLQQNSMKLKDLAGKQSAILDIAAEHGLDSDSLAKGKIKQAKFGKKLSKAADGKVVADDIVRRALGPNYKHYDDIIPYKYTDDNLPTISSQEATSSNSIGGPSVPEFANLTDQRSPNYAFDSAFNMSSASQPTSQPASGPGFGQKAWDITKKVGKTLGKGFDKYGPAVLSNVMPFVRPTNQRPLDPSQTYPEMMALALNQPEAVKAQTFQPMLKDQPSRISLQDQINTIDAQSRAAIRAMGENPAAQAQIQANAIDAKNRVLGEQFRMNQGAADQTYAANRATLNDAQLKNLQILDNQYTRQSEASSKTKQQAIEIAKSLAAKKLQNQMENRDLAIKENLYNYRFSPSGVAYNVNDPYQFNLAGTGNSNSGRQQAPAGFKFLYDAAGNVEDMKKEKAAKSGAKLKARNGAIVKAMKSL